MLRSIRRSWGRLGIVAVTMVVTGCGMSSGLGGASGWSFAVDNREVGVDYVIRYTSREQPLYLRLANGVGGIVHTGQGSPDPLDTIAILDPVTCRVITIVDPVPDGHNRLDLSSPWDYTIGSYDPADYGQPPDPERSLPATEKCVTSDSTATPAPEPAMVAGTWLRGWEMFCETAPGEVPSLTVRGETLDGATAGCEAHVDDVGPRPIDALDGISVWNPDGDKTRLGVAWYDTACASEATVSLLPTVAGYRAHVISIGSICAPGLKPHAVIFHLVGRLDATLVGGEVERIAR